MKPGTPWSVKGSEPEARATDKRAVREVDVALGEWLESTIADRSEGGGAAQAGTSLLQERFPGSMPRSRQRARAEPPPVRSATAPAQRPDSALTLQLINRKLADLAGLAVRIEENECKTVDALDTVNSRLSALSQQISGLTRPQSHDRPPEASGYRALESAIRNVAEHVELNEKRTRESLRSMQERLSESADRGRSASRGEDIHRAAPLLAGFDSRLTDVLNRIEHVESQLAERIKNVRAAAQQMANQAQSAAVIAARGELREFEGRLLAACYLALQTFTRPQQATDQAGRVPAASAPAASLATHGWSNPSAQPPRVSRSGPRSAAPAFDLARAVPEARALLARLGFGVTGAGERMDSRLANAIRLFELRSGLKVTGDLTPALLEKLRQLIA